MQVLFSRVLHRRIVEDAGVDVILLHPGEVMTNIVCFLLITISLSAASVISHQVIMSSARQIKVFALSVI